MWCSGVTAPRLMWPFLTWLMNWQIGHTLTGLTVYVLFVCVWCQFFRGRVHRRGDDLAPWVRSLGSRGRAKAERWSPSVSLAHGKVVITQDWLATGPLAPWLFLYLHFFCTLSLPQSLIFLPFAHPSLSTFQGCLLLSLLLSGISWANFHRVFFPHSATHTFFLHQFLVLQPFPVTGFPLPLQSRAHQTSSWLPRLFYDRRLRADQYEWIPRDSTVKTTWCSRVWGPLLASSI